MFLCTSRFNIEEQKTKILKEFFSQNKIKITKEKKNRKLDLIKILLISNTEENDHKVDYKDLIKLISNTNKQNRELELSFLQTITQIRISERKQKSREDNLFEYY
ncbi:unnamed protein product [Penicillium salamii]|uniref:Uncharacterized protein n=1 Tax=Penicillium salamii TaxID=1612424 RepID=A0A9W4IZR5_9EURO|nr:unnamed protein product [Penicillium salamii]CAG8225322.1 unnamed protein product [Penicillium salamii]CAG8273439.1 unnamed protein product [Penicillium salamii]CAG8319379.1 unnamed protein product [Penicillium salamii]CAG8371672.1 unnamed protein product [Penicillium salamii]